MVLLLLTAKFSCLYVAGTRNQLPSEVRVVTHDQLPFFTVTTLSIQQQQYSYSTYKYFTRRTHNTKGAKEDQRQQRRGPGSLPPSPEDMNRRKNRKASQHKARQKENRRTKNKSYSNRGRKQGKPDKTQYRQQAAPLLIVQQQYSYVTFPSSEKKQEEIGE